MSLLFYALAFQIIWESPSLIMRELAGTLTESAFNVEEMNPACVLGHGEIGHLPANGTKAYIDDIHLPVAIMVLALSG